jgi:nucleotide-binding universal stress UspA family protein
MSAVARSATLDAKGTEMKRIVIATDGSRDALTAVREGVALAQDVGAAVTFVCVRTPAESILGEPLCQAAIDEELGHARRAIDEAMSVATDVGVEADYEILVGSPVEAVLAVARRVDAWLIVVGSRGRGAVQGALLGNVSRALVTHADRPVLVARQRLPASAAERRSSAGRVVRAKSIPS